MKILNKVYFALVVLILSSAVSGAKVVLPSLLSDNMVLQRNSMVNIWGKATPNTTVTVAPSWDGKEYRTKVGKDGKWLVKVATSDAGGPYTLRISDGDAIELSNILLGEVWVASGQSNMEMKIHGYMNQPVKTAVEAIVDAPNHPDLRLFTVGKVALENPAEECKGEWLIPTPESVGNFSAAAYYFGETINSLLGVPVGIIVSAWGGSAVEAWMAEDAFESVEGVDKKISRSRKDDAGIVAKLFNGMINPITDYTAKGFIWYQGERNCRRHDDYHKYLKAMISDWRKRWGSNEMPFYMVQIAPYKYSGYENMEVPLIVEAQHKVVAGMDNVGIAATTDIGNPTGIHPSTKKEVGQRLAFLALQNNYGVAGLPNPAPTYKSMSIDGNKVTLEFNNVDEKTSTGNSFHFYQDDCVLTPKGFEIAGEDRVFYPAEGVFDSKNRITIHSDSVSNPVAVRYYFHNYVPEANVKTGLGQPLVPFRTDQWETSYKLEK